MSEAISETHGWPLQRTQLHVQKLRLFHRKINGKVFPLGNRAITLMLVKDLGTISYRMFNNVLVNLREDRTQSCYRCICLINERLVIFWVTSKGA